MPSLIFFLTFIASTAYGQYQLECDLGWGLCPDSEICVPLEDNCCYDDFLPYGCPTTHYCDNGGCCLLGELCTGGWDIDYSTYDSPSTSTTYDYTSYSYSSSARTSYTTTTSETEEHTITSYSTSISVLTRITSSIASSRFTSPSDSTTTTTSDSVTGETPSSSPSTTSAASTTASTSSKGAASWDHTLVGKGGAILGLGLMAILLV